MKKYLVIILLILLVGSCADFDKINKDPFAVSEDLVRPEYFLNNSITLAQMDPHIAERIFVLYWAAGARYDLAGFSLGGDNDTWSVDYYGGDYLGKWINFADETIQFGKLQVENNTGFTYTPNLIQIARIWRAYLISEGSDLFGPFPIPNAEGAVNFVSVEEIYKHILSELEDAAQKMDTKATKVPNDALDKFYAFDYLKWVKFANSLRLRYAMRLSEIDKNFAKTQFEKVIADASKDGNENLILKAEDFAQVQEQDGWNALAGVMSRPWNHFFLSTTINNLALGLGGITTEEILPTKINVVKDDIVTHMPTYKLFINKVNGKKDSVLLFTDSAVVNMVKPENYLGIELPDHLSKKTNAPGVGYYMDGLPKVIDPRMYKLYAIPGSLNSVEYDGRTAESKIIYRSLIGKKNDDDRADVNSNCTWNAYPSGASGKIGARNHLANYVGTTPRLVNRFRKSTEKRIFFASWETYFLLAEASIRGWNISGSGFDGRTAYEKGIEASFDYLGAVHVGKYLASDSYNRCGTSVNWGHTAEPPAVVNMTYHRTLTTKSFEVIRRTDDNIDPTTQKPMDSSRIEFKKLETDGTDYILSMPYAENKLYKDGTTKNDLLTKIITQKYLAQLPWLPLEAWNDHRRLGLPFFENPVREESLSNLPDLTSENVTNTMSVKYFPQRVRYPSSLVSNSPILYSQAKGLLFIEGGSVGEDAVLTPLWWAKHKP